MRRGQGGRGGSVAGRAGLTVGYSGSEMTGWLDMEVRAGSSFSWIRTVTPCHAAALGSADDATADRPPRVLLVVAEEKDDVAAATACWEAGERPRQGGRRVGHGGRKAGEIRGAHVQEGPSWDEDDEHINPQPTLSTTFLQLSGRRV